MEDRDVDPGQRHRATYDFKPVDHLVRREFYIWDEALARWKQEGLPADWDQKNLFQFDPPGHVDVGLHLGWCEPPFVPAYEDKVLRVDGDTEIIQDAAGRQLRVFRGRRHGFMPDYIRHPVTCAKDWQEQVAPRLDPADSRRYDGLADKCAKAAAAQHHDGLLVRQGMVGGYMYLRALIGPEDLLYALHDQPQLIHMLMERWAALMNTALEKVQSRIELDELAMAEDICYNHGLLISPPMVRRFLLPYYKDVVGNARHRQARKLHLLVDTDGLALPAIPLYLEAGMDAMMPFEVASGCDVVEIGRRYPELIITGGIDKRVLAAGTDAIDAHLQRIIPAMLKRGGYIPTCDHGVPNDVSFGNYLHYRKRLCEIDHA